MLHVRQHSLVAERQNAAQDASSSALCGRSLTSDMLALDLCISALVGRYHV